ncbi:MAG: arsenosugar biosynthesis radical SAM protein ArsS [Coriobacteriia bacterium]|nr:arsenosugar biosynthesis radical SAM protein ArsS [Coriobacteriia bacterium]
MQNALNEVSAKLNAYFPFDKKIDQDLKRTQEKLQTMQVNVGRLCNLACRHCHVEAGPSHLDEVMSKENMQHALNVFERYDFEVLDITGGAPEMNPNFEWLIGQAYEKGIKTMVRSNLTILLEEDYAHLPELYAKYGITLIASLPHYTQKATDNQRGKDVFDREIQVLKQLNSLGYGKEEKLELNLVYNPSGAFLPGDQCALERVFKAKLFEKYGIVFTHLFAITNNPVGRFGALLNKSDNLDAYMSKLIGAFNPAAVPALMCRSQLSISWNGTLFDCDFNQAAGISAEGPQTIAELDELAPKSLKREIMFANHCYTCTAGAGSSCGGSTVD